MRYLCKYKKLIKMVQHKKFMQVTHDLWLTAGPTCWIMGKPITRKDGSKEIQAQYYVHNFVDVVKLLLEITLKGNFNAKDIQSLREEHQMAVKRLSSLVQQMYDSKKFREIAILRSGVERQ